jgi:Mn2+/Fe2+ NRAMP family transporter
VKSILKIALGIIAALGGFLDIGDLVFNTQAGALYRYDLLWAVALGTVGIGVYAEMCGRVAAVTGRPVFDSIRMRLGFGMGLVALIASTVVNLLTVAAELGGLAIILTLLFDAAFSLFVVLAAVGLVIAVALLPFGGVERIFGYCGLLMLVFVATAIDQGPNWSEVAHGFVPSLSDSKLYLYFVVGVFAAALMPYEVHFYSSGAIEEGWTEKISRRIGSTRSSAMDSAASSPAAWSSSRGTSFIRSASTRATSAPSPFPPREPSARRGCCWRSGG